MLTATGYLARVPAGGERTAYGLAIGALVKYGDSDGAIRVARGAEAHLAPADAAAIYHDLGAALARTGHQGEAAAIVLSALERPGLGASSQLWRDATHLLARVGDLKGSLDVGMRAIGSVAQTKRSYHYHDVMDVLVRLGDPEAAIALGYDGIDNLGAGEGAAYRYHDTIKLLEAQGRRDEALALGEVGINALVGVDDDGASALYHDVAFLLVGAGNAERAIAVITQGPRANRRSVSCVPDAGTRSDREKVRERRSSHRYVTGGCLSDRRR